MYTCVTYSDTNLSFCKGVGSFRPFQWYNIWTMQLTLPKKYLSYSQIRLWLDDKEAYRNRYYLGLTSPGSKYLLFGSEFAQGLEDGTIVLPALTQYEVQEFDIKVDVDEVPFNGWVDQYSPSRNKFREIKTGSSRADGKPRWTDELVSRHIQLDVYSLCIWLKTGKVDDECHLDWVKTRPKQKCIVDFTGRTICAQSQAEMELTGEVEAFRRVVTHEDRMRAKALIKSVAYEISADYSAWLKANLALKASSMPV